MKDLRIVIPAYNEEKSIADVIAQVRATCPEAEIIVVDDCSKDNTAAIATEKGVTLIRNSNNLGKGGATKEGFKYNGRKDIEYLAFIDGDKTYPAYSFPQLYVLCKENNVDMVVGSRLLLKKEGMRKGRRFGNWIFATMLSLYSGKKTTDTSTGMRVLNKRILNLTYSLPNGLDFDTAMTADILFKGLAYAEIPIEYGKRSGNSKLSSIKDGWRFLRVIMVATRKYRPWAFYCTLGLPFLLIESFVKKSPVKSR